MSTQAWLKSSFSGEGNACLNLAATPAHILLRESDTPDVVLFTDPPQMRSLIRAVKAGRLAAPELR
ncbi:DUF397 domain-containing protein [Streptomyces stramineus]|uniref:DUF397 domain-containing protein n=1 Tax=Streptomyces stramineus TaxID=173861 RepID=A0ABN1A2Y5_9ACTN